MNQLSINIIDTYNLKTMGIIDTTVYGTTPVVNPTIEITPPGFGKKSLVFTTGAINIYNSNNMGITDCKNLKELHDLPDGIYRIRYSVFPNTTAAFETTHLRTARLKQMLYSQYLSYLQSEKKPVNTRKNLEDAGLLLNGALLATADEATAIALYRKAEKLLSTDQCGCC
jgi:hypothetical protein